MQLSTDRCLTTHGGRLERPAALTKMMADHERGRPVDGEFDRLLTDSVRGVVRQQADAGIDVVGDGEFGKIAWAVYLGARLTGFERAEGETDASKLAAADVRGPQGLRRVLCVGELWRVDAVPQFSRPDVPTYECTGPIEYTGHEALAQDLSALVAATEETPGVTEAFMPATSPGSVTFRNRYYDSDEDYIFALADALNTEYRAIVDAGVVVQIDDPVLPTMWDALRPDGARVYPDERAYLAAGELRVEAVNRALSGITRDRVRYHICWGSWHGPHSADVPLKSVLPLLAAARGRRLRGGGRQCPPRARVGRLERARRRRRAHPHPRCREPCDRPRRTPGARRAPDQAVRERRRQGTGDRRHRLRPRLSRAPTDRAGESSRPSRRVPASRAPTCGRP